MGRDPPKRLDGRTVRPRRRRASLHPRQYLLQGREEPRPAALGALVELRLIRREAGLLHAQAGPRARRGESPDDDGLETAVTFTLTPTRTGTHLRMEQTGFSRDRPQNFAGAKYGWQKFFANLEQVLARID